MEKQAKVMHEFCDKLYSEVVESNKNGDLISAIYEYHGKYFRIKYFSNDYYPHTKEFFEAINIKFNKDKICDKCKNCFWEYNGQCIHEDVKIHFSEEQYTDKCNGFWKRDVPSFKRKGD